MRTSLSPRLAALLLALSLAEPLTGQRDTVTVVPGARYAADGLKGTLLGEDYRDLWTVPIRVPVLDLGSYKGGLTPVRRGAGKQTISLRFRAGDGREYNFRSVDKDQTGGLHPDFQETFVDRVAQDQVHSKHPTSNLIVDAILDAAGVLHPEPTLFVMPDDRRLGEFREEFAGMLGTIEVHPDEGEGETPGFAGATRVAGTETLLEHLEEGPRDRVSAADFLKARLVDMLVGDWDRHIGQWRWARFDRDGVRWWHPVPEDRDNAFSDYDGLLMNAVRGGAPSLVRFRDRYPDLVGLTYNAQALDRRILSSLPAAAYDSVAAELRLRINDAVIDAAIAQSPPEHQRLRGAEIARELRARRDALPDLARGFYSLLATHVDVRATDEAERAEIVRGSDGSVEVRLAATIEKDGPARTYFERRFHPAETHEVRIYLQGGDDRAIVRGAARGRPIVRIIGGGGDDVLIDSAGGGRTAFYDDRGENRFTTAQGTVVDTRAYEVRPDSGNGFNDNAPAQRDWGAKTDLFVPSLEWRYNVGPVVGVGPRWTWYGFRRAPHARQLAVRALYGPLEGRFGADLAFEARRTNSRSRVTLLAHASQLEVTRFHGYGNQSSSFFVPDVYKVWETELRVAPLYHVGPTETLELFAGPIAQYTRPDPEAGSPAAAAGLRGGEAFGQLGGQVGALLDTRDLPTFPRSGFRALARGSGFAGTGNASGAFGGIDAFAATYLPVQLPLETTLAARAGGRAAFGEFPFQEAAFVGGSETVRGLPRQRFAGDAALYGGVELRTFLTRINFISRGDLGVLALADAGRVFVEGESSSRWHSAVGGGVWVGILDRTRVFSVVFAQGEERALYFSMGMPF